MLAFYLLFLRLTRRFQLDHLLSPVKEDFGGQVEIPLSDVNLYSLNTFGHKF